MCPPEIQRNRTVVDDESLTSPSCLPPQLMCAKVAPRDVGDLLADRHDMFHNLFTRVGLLVTGSRGCLIENTNNRLHGKMLEVKDICAGNWYFSDHVSA